MSEEKGGLLLKLAKPFKSQSHDSAGSKSSTLNSHEEDVISQAYAAGKARGEHHVSLKSSSSHGKDVVASAYAEGKSKGEKDHHSHLKTSSTSHDKNVVANSYSEGNAQGASAYKTPAVDEAYYEGKSQGYADKSTLADSDVVASNSVGKVLTSPPSINRKPVDRGLSGDFANQKNPIDSDLVTTNAKGKNSDTIEKNLNPLYTDETEVRGGTGYYFDPKDTQGGVYNNNDATEYNEATKATLPVKRNLKTEPTGSASADPNAGLNAQSATRSTDNYSSRDSNKYDGKQSGNGTSGSAEGYSSTKDSSNYGSLDGKQHGKESSNAGKAGLGAAGVAAGAVGAEKYSQSKHSKPTTAGDTGTDYDKEIDDLNKQIDSTQKEIDALAEGKDIGSDANSVSAVYNEPLASGYKSPSKDKTSLDHSGATYLGKVGGQHHIIPPNSSTSLDPKLANTQPVPEPAGHGVSTKSTAGTTSTGQPGVLDGAKGAIAGAGATAAAAVGYNQYSSHKNSATDSSTKEILEQSYQAGHSHGKREASSTTAKPVSGSAGHGTTSKSTTGTTSTGQPGVFDGARGAIAGVGAAAASAIGYNQYSSHSNSATDSSTKEILEQSYQAGHSHGKRDASSATAHPVSGTTAQSTSTKSTNGTDSAQEPGVFDGAKGAIAGVGAAAASAVGYNQHSSHKNSATDPSTKEILEQSYQAGHSHGKREASSTTAQPVSGSAGHGASTAEPGVLDGARGAIAGVGAAAASVVGYDAYSSHNDSTSGSSKDKTLNQSYEAGHSAGRTTGTSGSTADGAIGTGPSVYGSSSTTSSSTARSQPSTNAGKIEKPHLDGLDSESTKSDNSGYLAGLTGALGSAAAAIGFGGNADATQSPETNKESSTISKRDTQFVQGDSGSGIHAAVGSGAASSKAVEPTSHTAGDVDSSNKGTALGGISAAITGAAAAAVGAGASSKKDTSASGTSGAHTSNTDSLVEVAAKKFPDVDEQPAHSTKETSKIKEEINEPAELPSNTNKRDLEAEVLAHNKKVGVKNDDRSLLQVAEDNFEDVRSKPAYKGKGNVLEQSTDSTIGNTGDDVQEVPEEIFHNQNEFIRTGGKVGNLSDPPSKSSSTTTGEKTSAVRKESEPVSQDLNTSSHKDKESLNTSGTGKSSSGILGGIFGGSAAKQENDEKKSKDAKLTKESGVSSKSNLDKKNSEQLYSEGVKRGTYEAGQVKATEDLTKEQHASTTSKPSGSSSKSKAAGAGIASAGVIGAAGASAHRENSNLSSGSHGATATNAHRDDSNLSSGTYGGASSSSQNRDASHDGDSLTVEVIGVKDRGKASEIAHQASKELLKQGADLSSGKVVIDTNNKNIYKTGGSSSQTHTSAISDNTPVPPVGLDKDIGNKFHSEHEAAKANLESAAQHGELGNVEDQSSHSSSSAKNGQYASGSSATQQTNPSEILVTVQGTKNTSEATRIANKAVQNLSDKPELLAGAKELRVNSVSGVVTDETGEKLLADKSLASSTSSNSAGNSSQYGQGLGSSTHTSDSTPRTLPTDESHLSSSKHAPTSNTTSDPALANSVRDDSVHMPGAFVP